MNVWRRLLVRAGAGRPAALAAVEPRRWVVLDVESTGLDPRRDGLVAIAGVGVHFGEGVPAIVCSDSFEVVVQREPPAPADLDRQNILLHGVGVGAQRWGTPLPAALGAFDAWAGSAPRVGFHVDFDRVLLERARDAAALTPARACWLDLAPLAAAAHPRARARALDEWLDHFSIRCLARHEAVADTLATAELLLRLWPDLRRAGVCDVATARALARHQRWLQR